MFCGNCGARIGDGAAFCPRCGWATGQRPAVPRRLRPHALVAGGLLCAAALAFAAGAVRGVGSVMDVLSYYDAPLAAAGSSIYATYGLVPFFMALAEGAPLLAMGAGRRTARRRTVAVGVLVSVLLAVVCAALAVMSLALEGPQPTDDLGMLRAAVLPYRVPAAAGCALGVASAVALCLGRGELRPEGQGKIR